jgi:soluble lytic murein transglycosylase-like protein
MAIKDKNTQGPISSVASGIVAQKPAGPAQRNAAPLKGEGALKARLLADDPQADSEQKSEFVMDDLTRWVTIQRQQDSQRMATENADDMDYHLLTSEEILTKGQLTADEIRAADTRAKATAGIAVIETRDDKGQSRFLVGNNLSNYLLQNPSHTGRMTNIGEAQRSTFQSDFRSQNLNIDLSGSALMNPRLAKAIRENPTIASYVEMTFDAAKRNGINGVMLANQFWQESRFNPNAGSNMGAQGIGQIMPKYFTGKYGLNTAADFRDPVKSIEAGAAIMGEITRRYNGDQVLALAEYNGGKGAVDFAKKLLGKSDITGTEFVTAMEDQVRKFGKGDMSLWRNQTNDYVQKIAGIRAPEPA